MGEVTLETSDITSHIIGNGVIVQHHQRECKATKFVRLFFYDAFSNDDSGWNLDFAKRMTEKINGYCTAINPEEEIHEDI